MDPIVNPVNEFPHSPEPFQGPRQTTGSEHVPGPGLSDAARLVDTFVAPRKTFTDICRSSRWWLPFLISVLVSYAFVFTVDRKVGWSQVVENTLKQSAKQQERFADMEPTQASQARHQMASTYRYFAYSAPAFTLLFAGLCAAVLLATLNFGFAGEAKFGRMVAVWMYATLPLALKSMLAAAVLHAGLSPEDFNLQNPAGTNLGFYLPPDTSKGLITLASSIDIFTIWTVVLLIIGCAIVANVKRSSAAVAVIGWWAIIVLASVASAVVQS